MSELDLTRLPRGQREWAGFIDALGEIDDRAERYFLELKSDVDLNIEAGRAKVAKFILGAANRVPQQAARRFGGHGLLVLGVAKGAVKGIPFFEAKDLARSIKKYIGADGPDWDFESVRVDEDRDVIIVLVDPPKPGDPIWTCRKDGPENLRDGGIYIRGDGETREAKGDEVRILLERTKSLTPTADLRITIIGAASSYRCDPAVLYQYLDSQKERLHTAYRRAMEPDVLGARRMAELAGSIYGETPENRTRDQYVAQIENWEKETRRQWSAMLDDVAAALWPGVRVRVENLSRTFLEDVEVAIHIDGDIWALEKIDEERSDLTEKLPAAPRGWGPRHKPFMPNLNYLHLPVGGTYTSPFASPGYGSVSFNNGGSVDISLPLRELRPEEVFESADDEFVLLSRDIRLRLASGIWRVTARGHHDVYEGDLTVAVEDEVDISDAIRGLLFASNGGPDVE